MTCVVRVAAASAFLAILFWIGVARGQEPAGKPEAKPEAKPAAADGKKVDVRKDAGIQAVQQAQSEPAPKYAAGKGAQQHLAEFMTAKGWTIGWDPVKKRYFSIAVAADNCEDPAFDPQFCLKREILARMAILKAKAEIIRFINQEMSASEQLRYAGTDLNKKFAAELESLENKLDAQRPQLVVLLRDVDKDAATALEEASIEDLPELVLSAVRTLDKHFGEGRAKTSDGAKDAPESKAPDPAAAAEYHKVREACGEAVKALRAVKQKASEEKPRVVTQFTSEAQALAKMPLLGGTVVQQAESWSKGEKKYELAVLVCWSDGLEKAARASMTGEPLVAPANKADAVQTWLKTQDLGAMVGPRQYIDGRGQRHFLGISARPVSRNAALDDENRELAAESAQQMTVYSLFADVDVQSKAMQRATQSTTADPGASSFKTEESLVRTLNQSYTNMKIQGLGAIAKTVVAHPLTGRQMHVVVYEISPESAQVAMNAERTNMLGAIQVLKNQAYRRGRSEALTEGVDAARNDKAAHAAGRAQGAKDLEGAAAKPGKKTGSAAAKSGSVIGGDVQEP